MQMAAVEFLPVLVPVFPVATSITAAPVLPASAPPSAQPSTAAGTPSAAPVASVEEPPHPVLERRGSQRALLENLRAKEQELCTFLDALEA